MADLHASSERGFTLIEIVITTAIIATIVAAGVAVSLGSRSFAVAAAAAEFDHLLDSARTVARETEGATLVFAPDAFGDGTEVRVMAPGPDNTLTASALPVVHAHAAFEEAALGKAPFALVVHASGAFGGRPGYRLGDTTATGEVGCPAAGAFHFVIRAAGASADRVIPCRITLAATGPVAIATRPPATIAPLPTPCAGRCQPGTLPTPPASSPTCPPNFIATPDGCTPISPNGPRYHVTASLASPTMTVGGTDSITAQATLSNPTAVPAETPAAVPVMVQVQTQTICGATPTGAQPSGSTFTLSGSSAGTCTIAIQADASGVPGATADSTTLSVTVSSSPRATPPPPTCDLTYDGKCFHRIVDTTSQMFWKYVLPDSQCGNADGSNACWFVDSVQQAFLTPGFGFQPPVTPTDGAHELLFRISMITTVYDECAPFSQFAAVRPPSIQWPVRGIGSPTNATLGWGQPSLYVTINHVITNQSPNGVFDVTNRAWQPGTTVAELLSAVAFARVGSPYLFAYFSGGQPPSDSFIQWHPDFPGCDAAGDPNMPGLAEYGISGANLVFDIYQAMP